MSKIFSFFGEVRVELSKVVWPTRTETIKYTFNVILFSAVVAAILGAADLGLFQIFAKLIAK